MVHHHFLLVQHCHFDSIPIFGKPIRLFSTVWRINPYGYQSWVVKQCETDRNQWCWTRFTEHLGFESHPPTVPSHCSHSHCLCSPWTATSVEAADPRQQWCCWGRPSQFPSSFLREVGSHTSPQRWCFVFVGWRKSKEYWRAGPGRTYIQLYTYWYIYTYIYIYTYVYIYIYIYTYVYIYVYVYMYICIYV